MPYEILEIEEKPKKRNSTENFVNKAIGMPAAEIAERAFGLPADIISAAGSLGKAVLPESLSSLPGKAVDILHTGIKKALPSYASQAEKEKYIPVNLPTSENLKQGVTKKLTGESLQPENEAERFYRDVIADTATLLLPFGGSGVSLAKAAKTSLAGNTAATLVKGLGGGEGAQALSKIGGIGIYNLWGGKEALTKQAKDLYAKADEIGANLKVDAKPLKNTVEKLLSNTEKGLLTKDKKEARDLLTGVLDKINNGTNTIKANELTTIKRDLGDLYPRASKNVRYYLGKIKEPTMELLDQASKQSPEFAASWPVAERLYEGLNRTPVISDFIRSNLNYKVLKSPLVRGALGIGSYAGLGSLAGGLTGAAAGIPIGLGIKESAKFVNLLKTSKAARTYYSNALKAAADENKALLISNALKLDKVASKEIASEESSNRYEILE